MGRIGDWRGYAIHGPQPPLRRFESPRETIYFNRLQPGGESVSTDSMIAKAERFSAFIPAVAPGYNDRAMRKGHEGRARYFTDKEGSEEGDVFRAMLNDVAIPLADPKANRTIMITSFNEWYEDTQIEATQGIAPTTSEDDSDSGAFYTEGDRYVDYGALYLDILREAKDASERSLLGAPSPDRETER